MQDRPDAGELLDAIAELLEGPLLEATSGGLRHQARVAGNLCRILGRELALGAGLEAREGALLAEVLAEQPEATDARELSARLAQRLAAGADVALERRAFPALLEIVRGKLAVAKPGHDDYDFAEEQPQ